MGISHGRVFPFTPFYKCRIPMYFDLTLTILVYSQTIQIHISTNTFLMMTLAALMFMDCPAVMYVPT